jgi:hypothetical protein
VALRSSRALFEALNGAVRASDDRALQPAVVTLVAAADAAESRTAAIEGFFLGLARRSFQVR